MIPELTVFYDGLCPLCSREIEHYRRWAVPDSICFIDITKPEFDAGRGGIDLDHAQRVLHVQVARSGDRATTMLTGVDAFLALWQVIPRYRWLARLGRIPFIRLFLAIGYRVFAAVRPGWLRRKLSSCPSDNCKV
jgi:predicted DCC family thiol-disulfide oxidoreductase YuxK